MGGALFINSKRLQTDEVPNPRTVSLLIFAAVKRPSQFPLDGLFLGLEMLGYNTFYWEGSPGLCKNRKISASEERITVVCSFKNSR